MSDHLIRWQAFSTEDLRLLYERLADYEDEAWVIPTEIRAELDVRAEESPDELGPDELGPPE